MFSWKWVKANIRTVSYIIPLNCQMPKCCNYLLTTKQSNAVTRLFLFHQENENEKKNGYMIKCLLTEWGRAGLENIWFSVRTHGPCCAWSVRPDLEPYYTCTLNSLSLFWLAMYTFAKSVPVILSSYRLHNNHVKDTGNHVMYDHSAWFVSVCNCIMFTRFVLLTVSEDSKAWLWFFLHLIYNKIISRFIFFCDIQYVQCLSKGYQPKQSLCFWLRLITPTPTLIIIIIIVIIKPYPILFESRLLVLASLRVFLQTLCFFCPPKKKSPNSIPPG